jgi:hypothetical protein
MNFIEVLFDQVMTAKGNVRPPRDQAGAHAALKFLGALEAETAVDRNLRYDAAAPPRALWPNEPNA